MAKQNPYKTNTGVHIEWFTVKRSTIYALALSAIGLCGAGLYAYSQVFVEREPEFEQAPETDNTACFLDFDGTVKVRHAGTYEWVNATMGTALNRDDMIKTVGGSTAQVRLFDGTEYLLKPDSILVIEKAYEDPETRAKHVAVKLESGQITLNTPGRNVPGSRSDVVTPGAEASFDENTTADVSFDTSNRLSGFTIFRGGSAVRSGDQQVRLGASQAVDVTADSGFTDIIELPGVPLLIQPANLEILAVSKTTEFKWNPVDGARKYNVVLDRSPNFLDPILRKQRVRRVRAAFAIGARDLFLASHGDRSRGPPRRAELASQVHRAQSRRARRHSRLDGVQTFGFSGWLGHGSRPDRR